MIDEKTVPDSVLSPIVVFYARMVVHILRRRVLEHDAYIGVIPVQNWWLYKNKSDVDNLRERRRLTSSGSMI